MVIVITMNKIAYLMVSRVRLYPVRIKFVIVNRFNHNVFSMINSGNNVDNTVTVFKNPCFQVPGKNATNVGIVKLKLKT